MRYRYKLTLEQTNMLQNCEPCWPKVFKYAKLMEEGVEFPAVNIYFDSLNNIWKYNDGRHRVMAAKMANVGLYVKSSRIMGENL